MNLTQKLSSALALQGWGVESASPIHAGSLMLLILWWSCLDNHNYDVFICNIHVMSKGQHFIANFAILHLISSFCSPSSAPFLEPFYGQLWVSASTDTHGKRKLLWPRFRTMHITKYNNKYLEVSLTTWSFSKTSMCSHVGPMVSIIMSFSHVYFTSNGFCHVYWDGNPIKRMVDSLYKQF